MMRKLLAILVVSLCASACWDFVEPDFPGAGAPAVLAIDVFANEAGRVQARGLLAPGLTIGGLQRAVLNDTVRVYGVAIEPSRIRPNGSREYDLGFEVADAAARDLTVEPPRVEEVSSPPPIRWSTIRKLGPDTVTWKRGTELVLHIDTTLASSQPTPQIRQWFLELRGSSRPFRVSSDGLPPTTLRIPAEWLPTPSNDSTIVASLNFYQSGQLFSAPRNFLSNVTFTFALSWIVKVIS